MKNAEVSAVLDQEIKLLTRPLGFRHHKELGFVRRWSGGFDSISIPLVDYNPIFKFTLVFGIRLDAIEQFTRQFTSVAPGFEDSTKTALIRLDYFTGRRYTEYEVTNAAEIQVALQEAAAILLNDWFPLVDHCKTPQGLYAAINTPRGQIPFDHTQLPYCAINHVTLAYMCDLARLESLIAEYDRQMANTNPRVRAPFDRLVAYLRAAHPPET